MTSREFVDWSARSPSDRRAAADELENSFEHAAGPIDLRAYVGTRPEERFSALTDRPCVVFVDRSTLSSLLFWVLLSFLSFRWMLFFVFLS